MPDSDLAAAAARDAFYAPPPNPGRFDALVRRFVNDPRDVTLVSLALVMSACVFPLAALLFYKGSFPWWVGLAYLAYLFLVFVDRFILMLHATSHRALFKRPYRVFNFYIPWVLGPFMGESPETYFSHHVGMHHPENNLEDDLSSTMRYQRDDVLHFLAYFVRFFFGALFELAIYLYRHNRKALMRRTLFGELSFYAAVAALAYWRFEATLFVFILPFVIVRFLMMAGNWGQHAFIDPEAPENLFRSSITCIDSRYNRRAFNDGYHIVHHRKPTLHWTEMPGEFARNIELYAREKALVLRETDFFMVWLLLMTKQYRQIAKHYVHLGEGPRPSEDEIVSFIHARLKPIVRQEALAISTAA